MPCTHLTLLFACLLLMLAPLTGAQTAAADDAPEWHQHAHDAQNTSYAPQAVPTPWRWKWAWNGPDSRGEVSEGKTSLPRNVQPVTGAGRVYVAAGERGVYALDNADGAELWQQGEIGVINSTAAYDPDTGSVFALSTGGVLYRLDAASGDILAQFASGAASDLPLPPALTADHALFAMGDGVYALDKASLQPEWVYRAQADFHTPPAYSAARDLVIAVTEDLFVHAIDNASGDQVWHVRPTVRSGGPPEEAPNQAEAAYGWPAIADAEGLALVRYRLDWATLWNWDPWPTTNSAIRANLEAQPDQQALFALRLDDGSTPFIINVGHGGYGNGGYMPMGPQPVVRRLDNGQEVIYTVGRADDQHDGRWDSKFVEVLLNDVTVPGYAAGEVRFIHYPHIILTDEQPFVSMAGDHLLGGHWMAGYSLQITDRSDSLGAYNNRIRSVELPHITTSASNCGYNAAHYCGTLIQDGDPRTYPAGFFIYYNQGTLYDEYWSGYSSWVVSADTVYFRSTDGAIVALEHGSPRASDLRPAPLMADAAATPAPGPVSAFAPVISHQQAASYAGQTASVTGQIRYIFNNGKSVYLSFAHPHQGAFKVKINREHWGSFLTAPEDSYTLGQMIQATGVIGWYQGDPVMYITDPDQIITLSSPSS